MKSIYIRTTLLIIAAIISLQSVIAQGLWTIQISDFRGNARNGNVELSWKTRSEENLMQFEVEFSPDGRTFRNIGFVPAHNNVAGDMYEFQNIVWYTDSAFYRIKIVDKAHNFSYGEPIRVYPNKIIHDFVYPSVVTTGRINIVVDEPFDMVLLVGMNGTVFLNQQLSGKMGRIEIPISRNLASGTYIVQLRNRFETITQKIIIQN